MYCRQPIESYTILVVVSIVLCATKQYNVHFYGQLAGVQEGGTGLKKKRNTKNIYEVIFIGHEVLYCAVLYAGGKYYCII